MRIVILGLFFIFSCGKKNSEGVNYEKVGSPSIKNKSLSSCNVKFISSDTPIETASKSNRARAECNLSEEEILNLINY